jgi:hypothetical protein
MLSEKRFLALCHKEQGTDRPKSEPPLAATHCSTAARPLENVIEEIRRTVNHGDVDGVTGYSIQWRTAKGSTLKMQWGQPKSKLP